MGITNILLLPTLLESKGKKSESKKVQNMSPQISVYHIKRNQLLPSSASSLEGLGSRLPQDQEDPEVQKGLQYMEERAKIQNLCMPDWRRKALMNILQYFVIECLRRKRGHTRLNFL